MVLEHEKRAGSSHIPYEWLIDSIVFHHDIQIHITSHACCLCDFCSFLFFQFYTSFVLLNPPLMFTFVTSLITIAGQRLKWIWYNDKTKRQIYLRFNNSCNLFDISCCEVCEWIFAGILSLECETASANTQKNR